MHGAALALLTALATGSVVGFGWAAVDDHPLVLLQQTVSQPGQAGLARLLATPGMGHPMPVTNASLALDHAVWGVNPAGWHATSLVLLCLTAFLLPWFTVALGRMTGRSIAPLAAAAGAAIALMHPATAEVAGWVAARKDVCAGLFSVAFAGALFRTVETQSKVWWAATAVFLLAALGSKSTTVALPLVALWVGVRGPERVRKPLVGVGAIGGLFSAAAIYATRKSQDTMGLLDERGSVSNWLGGIGESAVANARLLLQPQPMVPFAHPTLAAEPQQLHVVLGGAMVGLLAMVGVTALVWVGRSGVARKRGAVSTASAATTPVVPLELVLLLALAAWLPVSSVLGSPQMASANRYMYLVLLLAIGPGFAVLIQWIHGRFSSSVGGWIAGCVLALALVVPSVFARSQALDNWRESATIGKRMSEAFPYPSGTMASYWSCDLYGMGVVLPHHNRVPGLGDSSSKAATHAITRAAGIWKACAAVAPRSEEAARGQARMHALVRQAAGFLEPDPAP